MKKIFRIIMLVLCLSVVTPAAMTYRPVSVEAAVKSGLLKENGKYYYYVKGVRVTNCWKYVKQSDGTYAKYYFGSNGAAYAAPYDAYHKKQIVCKKIGDYCYGFLYNGKMVKDGVFCDYKLLLHRFNSAGKRYTGETKKVRSYAVEGMNPKYILSYMKPWYVTRKITDSCYGEGKDYDYYYTNIKVIVFVRASDGKKVVAGVVPR